MTGLHVGSLVIVSVPGRAPRPAVIANRSVWSMAGWIVIYLDRRDRRGRVVFGPLPLVRAPVSARFVRPATVSELVANGCLMPDYEVKSLKG